MKFRIAPRTRRRTAVIALREAERVQQEERRAAVRRLLDLAFGENAAQSPHTQRQTYT
jgi:hypothetical protein